MADLTLRSQSEEAARALRSGRPQETVAICRRILQTFPRHVGTYRLLGRACLEMGRLDDAAGLFQRVLSADPEHAPAHADLAAVHGQRGATDEALWHLQRAVELAPGNHEIRDMLRRFYGRRFGRAPARIKMTRAALARVYLAAHLHVQAIAELRELAVQEQRLDLQVALAEALWRESQYEEAQAVCGDILQDLPNCLKANLILGQLWLHSDRDEQGRELLQRAQAIDPENATAQAIFGARSPLPPRLARLPLTEQDMPPLELPYLVAEEEEGGVEEYVVIEGQVAQPSPKEASEPEMGSAPAATEPDIQDRASVQSHPLEAAARVAEEAPRAQRAAAPEGISLLDIRRQYVEEHPEDYQARLDLARRLRDLWKLDQALEQYKVLVQQDFETLSDVVRDLSRLDRIYPATPDLVALLRAARERERKYV